MRTDPELIARLSAEIDARFSGSRVRDVGRLPDGRIALVLWSRGHERMLCIDVFGTPPLITVEEARELSIESEAGFIRATGAALRGTTLLSAKARKGDRLVRLTFGTRSRFGVGDESDLYIELVPRFGNIVLVRKDRIVAALKEFSLAENTTRAVEIGQPYALPPLLARMRPDSDRPLLPTRACWITSAPSARKPRSPAKAIAPSIVAKPCSNGSTSVSARLAKISSRSRKSNAPPRIAITSRAGRGALRRIARAR